MGEIENIYENQVNLDKHLKHGQILKARQRLATYKTLDPCFTKKFIISQFKNINFKNLSKQKKTKKELNSQLGSTNQTYDP
jgi:hypothetical protein